MPSGVFREGQFEQCGDGAHGVPQCMGRAAHNCEGPAALACYCCTCPTFTAAEMRFARAHRLTIESPRDMPIEWQQRRGLVGPRWEQRGVEDVCSFCRREAHIVRGPEPATICEECARLVLSLFVERREITTGRKLVAIPSTTPASPPRRPDSG